MIPRTTLFAFAGLILAAGCAGAESVASEQLGPVVTASEGDLSPYPPASELLETVLRAIPPVPVEILAEVQSRDPHGKLDRLIRLETMLHAGEDAYEASYKIHDAFGGNMETLDVTGTAGLSAMPTYTYYLGDPPEEMATPELTGPIQGTDISWSDLAFSFLWWPGGTTVGADRIKGRFCYVIDIPAPAEGNPAFAGMRVWIDPALGMFLRADGYDGNGERIRRLEVKSFKKLNEMWLIKNIEVKSYPSEHRTLVRVRSVKEL